MKRHSASADSATELRRRNRELEILNAIAAALNASADLDTSLHTVLARVAELLDLRTGWVWLLADDGEPYVAARQDLPPGLAEHPERMEGDCYCLDTFRQGDLTGAANVNVVTCSRLRWLTEGTGGLRYHASIPIEAHGRKLGVMNVASPEWRRLSASDLRILRTVGDMLGVAVERAQLYDRSIELGAAEERNRLAREIHDTLAQGLSAIALRLDTAEALLEGRAGAERVGELVGQALEVARAGLDEARRTVLDLRAAPLEGRTLAEALEELITGAGARGLAESIGEAPTENAGGPVVAFEVVGAARPLPSRIEVGLYRIAREAISNALRHAGAAHIGLRLHAAPDAVELVVEDDGHGIAGDEAERGRFGLVGMRERARLLGGALELETGKGVGTRLSVRVPLRSAARGVGP